MKRLFVRVSFTVILTLAVLGGLFVYSLFGVVEVFTPPTYRIQLVAHPVLSAASWIVFDVEEGEILYSHNAQTVYPIASVTKLLTAAEFYRHNDLLATTSITWTDLATEGRAGNLRYGRVYQFHELLFPLLLESSNDAAVAMLRVDEALLQRMNTYTETHGLESTHLADTSGLSDYNVSSASDLKDMARIIYRTVPHIIDITRLTQYLSHGNGWMNNNPFSGLEGYMGGKHGYTPEAGKTAVAFFSEPIVGRENRVIGYVLLQSADLEEDMSLLRDFVVRHTTYR